MSKVESVCPVISNFVYSWHNVLPYHERGILQPLFSALEGSKVNQAVETLRSEMVMDWLIQEHIPVWLQLADMEPESRIMSTIDWRTAYCNQFIRETTTAVWERTLGIDLDTMSTAWSVSDELMRVTALEAAMKVATTGRYKDGEKRPADMPYWEVSPATLRAITKEEAEVLVKETSKLVAWKMADMVLKQGDENAHEMTIRALQPVVQDLQDSALNLLNRMIVANVR